MRPCTPMTSAPSATGQQYRPRRRPKRVRRQAQIGACTDTPTPVQQLCTHVQSCGQSAFFSYTGRGAFSFWARPKREWGAHPPVETAPLREQPPWPLFSGRKRKRTAFRRSKRPLMPGDGPSDTHPSAAASPHGCKSGWTRCPHGPASPEWSAGPPRSPADGRRRSGAGCGA